MGITAGTAALAGGALSAAGSVGSALIQSGNAGGAAKTSQRNLELMLPQIQQNYVNQQGLFQPFYRAGQQGLTASTDLLGLNGPDAANAAMANYRASPDYNFRLTEGLRAVDALGAAGRAMPGLRSGAVLKAEQAYGEGLAGQDFGNYFNRLLDLSKMGQTAAGQEADIGQNLIANMQGNATSQNALAIGSANAQNSILGNTTSGIGNTLNSLLQNKDVLGTINGWLGSGSGGTNLPGTSGYNPNLTVGGYSAADNFF